MSGGAPAQKMDGMNYAPVARVETVKVCGRDEFRFSVVGLDHGHVHAMCNGLIEAGATPAKVWDGDRGKVADFLQRHPGSSAAESVEEILADPSCALVVSASRPRDRCALGLRVMEGGKDFFVDKPGMLSLGELEAARAAAARTGRKYILYFGERIHVEGAVLAERLIAAGAIGRVIHVTILAPHRLNAASRPDWFFDPGQNGGIITDIGSHQVEQFLAYSGAASARVARSSVANYANPGKRDFRDFGDGCLVADNGATCYFRVDWFTPDGLGAWGDGRVFIVGTDGTLEIRKYIDIARSGEGDRVFLADRSGERMLEASGTVGFPFFGAFILDCMNRSETAITQERCFEAMRIALTAQAEAEDIAVR